jgi:predicted XRE-type DNA-binding protein
MKKIDTVRRITRRGLICLNLASHRPKPGGITPSRAQIDHTLALKEQLMGELASWIEEHHLRQAEAAEILCVTRPRVSDVVNRKTSKFTIDALVDMLARIGKPVSLVVG